MNVAGIKELMSCLGDHDPIENDQWVQASCPAAFALHRSGRDTNPSFGIMINDAGKSGYNCFSCRLKGDDLFVMVMELRELAKKHGHTGYDFAKAMLIVEQENDIGYVGHEWEDTSLDKVFDPWPEWYLEKLIPAWSVAPSRNYLLGRNVSADICKALDIRFDTKRDMVCFPVRNHEGYLSGVRGRSIGGTKHYDYVWNKINNTAITLYGEAWVDPLKPVVIVEGEFDLAAVYPVYSNVMALFMASVNKRKTRLLQTMMSVLVMTDSDLAGEQVFWHLRDVMPDTRRIEIPEGKKDPGEMTREEIRAALRPFVRV